VFGRVEGGEFFKILYNIPRLFLKQGFLILWSENASLALRRYTGRRYDTMTSIVAVPVNFQVIDEKGRCGWSSCSGASRSSNVIVAK